MPPTVFLDTNVFKFAATSLHRYRVEEGHVVQWGPLRLSVPVYTDVLVNPNEGIANPKLKAEAELLPAVAALGLQGLVRFVISTESRYEQWGLPNLDADTGMFFGATLETIDAPFTYGRVMGGLGIDGDLAQRQFLEGISDPRFMELQKATGAYQGKNPRHRNQLLDAFHLWCAEHHCCEFFLTLDFKLIRVVTRSPLKSVVRLVTPSELLRAHAAQSTSRS